MKCACCPNEVEEERIELLDSKVCAKCANSGIAQDDIPRAATIYNEDGTTEVQLMHPKDFEQFKRMVDNRDNSHGCA